MLDKLAKYIHQQKKKGFKDTQIHTHLRKHGWQGSHIRSAYQILTKKNNQRFIAYSIWYILVIFIVTVSLVQLSKYTSLATEGSAYCFGTLHGVNTFFDKTMCCSAARNLGCAYLKEPMTVKDAHGKDIFWGKYRCYGPQSNLYFEEGNFLSC